MNRRFRNPTRIMKHPRAIAMILALGGCTASYTEPSLPADHPANATAPEVPLPPASKTLDLSAADPITPEQGGAASDHAGHDMGDMTPPEPSSHGMEGEAHEHGSPSPPPDGPAIVYACPMHPEVTSDKPGQRCPKCGMALVKREQEEKP